MSIELGAREVVGKMINPKTALVLSYAISVHYAVHMCEMQNRLGNSG